MNTITHESLTRRNRLTLRVAAAISGTDPWAYGYTEHTGTARTLRLDLVAIKRAHGTNAVMALYHKGQRVETVAHDVALTLQSIWDDGGK